jgi:hypothetical protein
MAPENHGYHVEPGEPAVSARRRASGLHFAGANLSAVPELLLRRRCLQADRCSLHRGGRRVRHLLSGIASIGYAGLKQLDNCCLIRVKQFIRPLQTLKTLVNASTC